MKIIAVTDMHGDIQRLTKLSAEMKSVDLVVFVGDITNFGRRQEIKEIIEFVQESNDQILAVSGNCDYPEVKMFLQEKGLCLEDENRQVSGIHFAGLGASLATPFNATPNEVPDEQLALGLEKAAFGLPDGEPMILISHQPPILTTADKIKENLHVGSNSVRNFIQQHQPLICFCGHIHEGIGIDSIQESQIINPGPFFRGQYAYAEITEQVEFLEIRSV